MKKNSFFVFEIQPARSVAPRHVRHRSECGGASHASVRAGRRGSAGQAKSNGKILVVLELSGGNDGLNTLVPYGDDAYYQAPAEHRHPAQGVRPIDDHFGFSRGMAGFERMYKNGKLAIVHGCGYENPSFSHFTSMAYWHTAAPNSGEQYGWVGRLADADGARCAAEFSGEYRHAAIARRSQPPPRAGGFRRSQQIFAGSSSTSARRRRPP
jgi:uncharacterized protein (DUF1501 family)